MALPLKSWFTIFNAISATTTARVPGLGSEHPEHANSIILEIVAATSPSWTLDIQGRTHQDGTYVAVDYIQIWQAGIAAFANSQLSITDTTRRFYLIPNCPPFLQLVGTRTAGTLTVLGCYTSEVFAQWLVTGARGELRAGGDVAHDGVDAGFPLKIGGQAQTGAPAAVAASDRVNANFDEFGSLRVVVTDPGTGVEPTAGNSDIVELTSQALVSSSNTGPTAIVNARGMMVMLDITAVSGTSPTMDLSVQVRLAVGTNVDVDMTDSGGATIGMAQKTATGRDFLHLAPGLIQKLTGTQRMYSALLPRRYRLNFAIAGTSPSFTMQVSTSLLV